MPKLIIDVKKNLNKNEVYLEIDGEIKKVLLNENREIDIEYGEHTLSVYENFIGKSKKEKINIVEKETEIEVDLNYTLFIVAGILNVILVGLIISNLFLEYGFFIILIMIAINFTFLVKFGIYKLNIVNSMK